MSKGTVDKEIAAIFEELLNEYFNPDLHAPLPEEEEPEQHSVSLDLQAETQLIDKFLKTTCSCGSNCQNLFTLEKLTWCAY